MKSRILTGTASWTDPGFVKEWYPSDLPAAYRLRWYAEHFSLVEVNSTFYRVPEAKPVSRWCGETPDGFVFDVKLHKYLSRHSTSLDLLPAALRGKANLKGRRVLLSSELEKAVARAFLKGIEPLRSAGKLGALLLQLSPAFSPRQNRLEELDSLVELLEGSIVAIELRNGNWVTAERLAETRKFFVSRKLVFVMVDAPEDPHFTIVPNIDLVTHKKLAYLRAHGRNAKAYIRERTVAGRFDYQYRPEELRQIAERALRAGEQCPEVHVVYNNNKADYAPRAATQFQAIVREEAPDMVSAEAPQQAVYG